MARDRKETRLIIALASGASAVQAAKKAGCSRRTVFNRLNDDAFRREVARFRGRIFTRSAAMLAKTSSQAIRTLRKLLDDDSPAVRRMAAKGILDAMGRLYVLRETEERIAELESAMQGDIEQ